MVVLAAILISLITAGAARAALAPLAHPLFDEDAVHEIHLTFHQAGWWEQLVLNFAQEDPPYLAAEFDWADVHCDSIGVRFKGNSSYGGYPGVKKSFKLDIDEFVPDQTVHGLDKLNLNNGFMDPSFVREQCCYELCAAVGLPTERTNFAALYINGDYWGLYTLVEQFDHEFIESRFGAGEDGNLWKGDPRGTLEYLGPNEPAYYGSYELETNEEENDWSALVEFVDKLNNTPLEALSDSLHNVADVSSALAMLAIDILTVNLDSYIGRCSNYYFYHRDLDSRLVFAQWDLNESWGVFNMWGMSVTQLRQLDPYWTSTLPGENRPLAERLWDVVAYRDIYVGHLQRLMATAAQPDLLIARMETLRDLIRPHVYADGNKMFTNQEFENAMSQDIVVGSGPHARIVPGLEPFIRGRDSWLRTQIGSWTPIEDLVLNELMARNDHTVADEFGEYEDWIEITNIGSSPRDLTGLGLTDHHDGSAHFTFPAMTLDPAEYLIVWADEEVGQGALHAPFKLDASGEDLYLLDGAVVIDQVTFPLLGSDQSFGRWPDGRGDWQLLSAATPGAENQNPEEPEEVTLFINEFLALNETGLQDELGEYEDWAEIYNPGPDSVQMGGLFLTDELALTTQWAFPDTLLPAGEFLIVWCDDDPSDGPLHTNFRLSGSGEEIGLFGRLIAGNDVIDSYLFGAQTADISEGRQIDGGLPWVFFDPPTPGASNEGSGTVPGDPGDQACPWAVRLYPQPYCGETLTIDLRGAGRVLAEAQIFDPQGRCVRTLLGARTEVGAGLRLLWDGREPGGRRVAAGIYYLRLRTDLGQTRHAVIVMR